MPGAIPHLIAGSAMFIIGKYYFKNYFEGDGKIKELLLLAVVCLSFSCIPDVVLIIYYTTHIMPFNIMCSYHVLTHFIFSPVAIVGLLLLKYRVDIKRSPIWIMGLWSIVLHVLMDLIIPEFGVWI